MKFNSSRGFSLLQILVMGLILTLSSMAIFDLIKFSINQRGAHFAKQRSVYLRDQIRILANGFCDADTFGRVAEGEDFRYNLAMTSSSAPVPLKKIFLGSNAIAISGSKFAGSDELISIKNISLQEVRWVTDRRRIVDVKVVGTTLGDPNAPLADQPRMLGGLRDFEYTHRLELYLDETDPNPHIDHCVDRATYFETAVATRSAFGLQNVGCNATRLAYPDSAYSSSPTVVTTSPPAELLSWNPPPITSTPTISNPYRWIPSPTPSLPGPLTYRKAILGRNTCAPAINGNCPTDCNLRPGSFYDGGQKSCNATHFTQIAKPSDLIPVETYKRGCDLVSPTKYCDDYADLTGSPENFVVPVSTDHPALGTPDWGNYFPIRQPGADKIDMSIASPINPNHLSLEEKRCWVKVVTKPRETIDADQIFFVDPIGSSNEDALSIGCRTTTIPNPISGADPFQEWQLMGCIETHAGAQDSGSGDRDINLRTITDSSSAIPRQIGRLCSTNDHTQPHSGSKWSMYQVKIGAICGHLVKSDP